MSRLERRHGFMDEHRIRLLEGDMDDIANSVDQLRQELTTEIEGVRQGLGSIRNVLVGALVMLTTSSVLLGLNLAIGS